MDNNNTVCCCYVFYEIYFTTEINSKTLPQHAYIKKTNKCKTEKSYIGKYTAALQKALWNIIMMKLHSKAITFIMFYKLIK